MSAWYWNYEHLSEPFAYGPDTTYEAAAKFLDGGPVEDWGCGTGYARKFFPKGYVGIDLAPPFSDVCTDIRNRLSLSHVLLRHVLEHNEDWERILKNALFWKRATQDSARRKVAIVIFTPFSDRTHVIGMSRKEGCTPVPDISFRKEDLTRHFPQYKEQEFETGIAYGKETLFCVTIP